MYLYLILYFLLGVEQNNWLFFSTDGGWEAAFIDLEGSSMCHSGLGSQDKKPQET